MSENLNETKKRGLGRGLGSLLGGSVQSGTVSSDRGASFATTTTVGNSNSSINKSTQNLNSNADLKPSTDVKPAISPVAINTEGKVWQISIEKIKPGIYQPRRVFDKQKIEELAQSIKANGLLQPIVVRKKDGEFEIVAGERRWRAAQAAGLHDVSVIIKDFSDKETLELSIIENIQREDLNPLEEAEGYFRLMNEFSLSHQQIAERVGKERASVTNSIRLLSLPREIKDLLDKSDISVGHAKVLLGISDLKKQIEFAELCANEKLSVRALEKAINKKNTDESLDKKSIVDTGVTERLILGLGEELQKILSTKVNIDYKDAKGKISIHFYSDDELSQLIDRLKEGVSV